MQEARVRSLGWEDPLEEGEAIHASIPIWRILYGQRSLGGCSPWGGKESDTMEQLSTAQAFTAKQFQIAHLIILGNGYHGTWKKKRRSVSFFFLFKTTRSQSLTIHSWQNASSNTHTHSLSPPPKTIKHKTKNNRRGRGFRTQGWKRHTSHQTMWDPRAQHLVPCTTH